MSTRTERTSQLTEYTREDAERLYLEFCQGVNGLMMSVEFYWYMLETEAASQTNAAPCISFDEWRGLARVAESMRQAKAEEV